MAYKALYRTYRPSTFEEVAGQKHIVQTLQNALATNKIAHAYLFCGPRGTGKTSMAKLLAKALNCEEGIGHQCNHCSNCLAVTDGSHPDVIEIDAASNNGVDEVRDLIEKVKYSPIKGRYKVYIIDEVHMMTSGAFNALLKTLEEPPAHVIFILATTEAHKVLPTIVSRCQSYDFTKVDDADIIARLKTIFAKENITYEDKALESVAALADGGVRDALSIADQVIAYSGSNIKEKDVEDLFGLASIEEKINFIQKICEQDTKYVLDKMHQFVDSGIDIKRLTIDLLDILKDTIIMNKTGDDKLLVKLTSEQAENLTKVIDNSSALEMINILLDAQKEYKYVSNINTLFQITLLKLLNIKGEKPKQVIVEKETEPKIEQKDNVVSTPINTPAPSITKEESKVEEEIMDDVPINKSVFSDLASDGEKNKLDEEKLIEIMVTGNKEMKLNLIAKWEGFNKYKLHPTLGKFASLLANGRPFVMNDKILVLEYQFQHEADKVNIIANQKPLTDIIKMVTGVETKLYALSRNESYESSRSFMERRQVSKLPHLTCEELIIDIKGE